MIGLCDIDGDEEGDGFFCSQCNTNHMMTFSLAKRIAKNHYVEKNEVRKTIKTLVKDLETQLRL